jgi:hypothetical protein
MHILDNQFISLLKEYPRPIEWGGGESHGKNETCIYLSKTFDTLLDTYDFFDKILNNLINVELALVLQYVNETIPIDT